MKNLRFLACVTVVFSMLLLGTCSGPYSAQEPGKTATITINLGGGAARSATGFGGLDFSEIDHEVFLVKVGTSEKEPIILDATGKGSIEVIPGTEYRVDVEATVNGWPYSNGSSDDFTVEAGEEKGVKVEMGRLSDAIVLSVPKDEFLKGHDFPPFSLAETTPTWTIKVSNYTGTPAGSTPATITASAPGFTVGGAGGVTLGEDTTDGVTITITPNATPTAVGVRQSATLTITAGSFSESVPLRAIVGDTVIRTRANLAAMPLTVGQYHVLADNIDLENIAWTPIGAITGNIGTFNGTFDGNGYTISGLFISGNDWQGLFETIGLDGKVINLGVKGSVTARDFVGGIAGRLFGTVENCYSDVAVSGRTWVGGIAGTIGDQTNRAYVLNCYAIGSVTGVSGSAGVGGIAGRIRVGSTAENNVALNPSITRPPPGGTAQFGRVVGDIEAPAATTVLNNNHADSNMVFFQGTSPQPDFPTPDRTHNGKDGVDFTSNQANWASGPGWTIHASREDAKADIFSTNPSRSPWWWDADETPSRPKLWNDG